MADSKEVKQNNDLNVEADFEKFKNYGENARMEYEKLFKEMWSNLNEGHLEPFAKIILERENIVLKGQDQLIDSIRKHAEKALIQSLNVFWETYGVSEALISLEMCKEKFKAYEGHKWDINSKTPEERTRPIRMRFKENRSRYLQAQLNFQQKELDETLKLNMALRQQIQDVKQQRIYLMENMDQHRKKFAEAKKEIMRLQNEMLDDEETAIRKYLKEMKMNDVGDMV